jgi:hypothetical protein
MNIRFNKTIKGADNLDAYLTPQDSIMHDNKSYTFFDYDDDGLLKSGLDSIQSCFENNNYELNRTASNTLWVSKPEPFSMRFDVAYFDKGHISYRVANTNFEKVGSEKSGGRIFKKEIPMFQEVPIVTFSGNIYFESLNSVDPVPVLKLLNELGYAASVNTTSQELQEAIERAKQARK